MIIFLSLMFITLLNSFNSFKLSKLSVNPKYITKLNYDESQLMTSLLPFNEVISQAAGKAFNGGVAGASASAIQVATLMWLRTAMNYQYRYGNTTSNAIKTLYQEGGIPRLYQGISFALIQGPTSRFGDTASNLLIFSIIANYDPSHIVPIYITTGLASIVAGLWRIIILPLDTIKTSLQVYGKERGIETLKLRFLTDGISTLYAGSLASCLATIVGHFPWFLTFNYLSLNLPTIDYIHSISINNIGLLSKFVLIFHLLLMFYV